MKKLLAVLLSATLLAGVFTGCSKPATKEPATDATKENVTIKVGASPTPHAEILEAAKATLAEQGITLEIIEFTDYVQPNTALEAGDLDANFFQHEPYLLDFNEKNGTKIVNIGAIHYEPMGIYAGKTADIASLADGAKISVPNDPTNEARALLLLETNGLIKINPDAGLAATKLDITENPKNFEIIEMEAAQLALSIQEVDLSVINGNFAMQAGLDVSKDSLAKEEKDSLAATTYANIVAAREGDEKRTELVALVNALKSEPVKSFIAEKYAGSVQSLAQ